MPDSSDRVQWRDALREAFEHAQRASPPPKRQQLSAAQEQQCRVIGGGLIAWLNHHGLDLLHERRQLHHGFPLGEESENDPAIIFLSDAPGLVASREILDPPPDGVFFFSTAAFETFQQAHPDPAFRWHVIFSSRFIEALDAAAQARASAAHALRPGESFWLHHENSLLGERFGRGAAHLWKWDGYRPALLEECFESWIS